MPVDVGLTLQWKESKGYVFLLVCLTIRCTCMNLVLYVHVCEISFDLK